MVVIAGKDKGKSGNITSMITDKDRVIVSGINIVKRHRKATQENPGKIEEIEASIHISNVSHIDPDTGFSYETKCSNSCQNLHLSDFRFISYTMKNLPKTLDQLILAQFFCNMF
mgnify:CR=1 FL=1